MPFRRALPWLFFPLILVTVGTLAVIGFPGPSKGNDDITLLEDSKLRRIFAERRIDRGSTADFPRKRRLPLVTIGQEECSISNNVSCPAAPHS